MWLGGCEAFAHNGVGMSDYKIKGYHIHVYFEAATRPQAEHLRDAITASFPKVAMGRWHDKPVGPHPDCSYQVAFGPAEFSDLVPFVAKRREGLNVFLHGLSGDDIRDHTDLAMWMGSSRPLVMSALE